MHTQTSNTYFQFISPFNITPLKRAHKAKTSWYHGPFHLSVDRNNKIKESSHKCTMVNASVIWQQAAHTTYYLLAAQQLLFKNVWKFSGKSQEKGPLAEKLQDRKSKRTRQKNKRGDRKGDLNNNPKIPDSGETSYIPCLSSGWLERDKQWYRNRLTNVPRHFEPLLSLYHEHGVLKAFFT